MGIPKGYEITDISIDGTGRTCIRLVKREDGLPDYHVPILLDGFDGTFLSSLTWHDEQRERTRPRGR